MGYYFVVVTFQAKKCSFSEVQFKKKRKTEVGKVDVAAGPLVQ